MDHIASPLHRHGFGTRRVSASWGAWAGPRFLVEAKAKAKAKVEKPVLKRPAKVAGQGELGQKLKEFLQVGALNFEIRFFLRACGDLDSPMKLAIFIIYMFDFCWGFLDVSLAQGWGF